jgi:hypothetical protein
VNLPTADQIGVIDASTGKIVAKWGSWLAAGNFPMALDDAGHRLFFWRPLAPLHRRH